MNRITLTWPIEVKYDGGSFKPPTAEVMCEIGRDAWASDWKFSARSTDRHELSLEVQHLRELMDRIGGIKRVFSSFGITPEIEVDGVPFLEFTWQKQVEAIHRLDLINQVIPALRRRNPTDDGNAAIRVALRDGLNKPFAEIEAGLLNKN